METLKIQALIKSFWHTFKEVESQDKMTLMCQCQHDLQDYIIIIFILIMFNPVVMICCVLKTDFKTKLRYLREADL